MINTNEILNQEIDMKLAEHILKNRDEMVEQLWNTQKTLRTLTTLAIQIEEDYSTFHDLISLIDCVRQRLRNIESALKGEELKEEIKILA